MTIAKRTREDNILRLVRAFPHQPDEARIPSSVVDLLFGISRATRWRRIAAGKLPRPSAGGFLVGEVRSALAEQPGAR